MAFSREEVAKLEKYIKSKLGAEGLQLRDRKTEDSLEATVNGEFIGVIYKDEEDGDTSYTFTVAILDIDLE